MAGVCWVQNEPEINYNWSTSAPGNGQWGLWADNFSVRWVKHVKLSQGEYVFTAAADDKVKVWIDETLLIDAFLGQQQVIRSISAGEHNIRVEFTEGVGGAAIQFSWKPSRNKVFIPIIIR